MVSITLFNPYYLLFLPANSGFTCLPGVPASVHRKIMAEISDSSVEGNPGAPGGTTSPNHKFPEKWYSSGEFGSFS